AARQRGRGLAERQVAEPYGRQHRELVLERGRAAQVLPRLLDRQVEGLLDVLAAIADLEHLGLVARAVAGLARQQEVGEKIHLDLDDAVALAGLAAPAWNVEREHAG